MGKIPAGRKRGKTMLTKDLLLFRCSGKNIFPSFLPLNNGTILALAEDLLLLYHSSIGKKRKELQEEAMARIARSRDLKLAKGLLKLLEDNAEYTLDSGTDFSALRESLFSSNAAFFREGKLPPSPEEFRKRIFAENSPFHGKFPCNEIYGDLPENERLIGGKFPENAVALIHYYNLQLVRSLLIYASALELILPAGTPPGALRLLFRDLLFYRLLASAKEEKKGGKKTGKLRFTIEGPGVILENSQKYALNLASFFPAVCRLGEWKLEARILLNGKERNLKLKSDSPLKVPPGRGGGYVPEEIRLFAEYFGKESRYILLPEEERKLYTLPSGELIFPDLSFRDPEKDISYHLELFHPWHAGKIREHLTAMDKGLLPGLILGIDKKCVKKDPLLEAEVKKHPFAFLFSNFPGVEKVEKFLAGLPEQGKKK